MKKFVGLFLLAFVMLAQDSVAQFWAPIAEMNEARVGHSSTMLQDGRILIVGGGPNWQSSYKSAEIYDYRDNSISAVPDMAESRLWHEAVLLDDGRLLVAGGCTKIGSALNTCQIFDPVLNDWVATPPMEYRRERFAMVKLNDGRVMATGGIGGWANDSDHRTTETCEIYDPATNTWTRADDIRSNRNAHAAITLQDGRVLATNGYSSDRVYRRDCDIYDPVTDTWTATADFLENGTGDHRMSMLSDGRVLRTGGWAGPKFVSEIYDPATGEWTVAGKLNVRRNSHAQLTLPDDRVIVIGGSDAPDGSSFNSSAISSVEEFDPAAQEWTEIQPLPRDLTWLTAHYMPNGQLIVVGGANMRAQSVPSETSDLIFATHYGADDNSALVMGSVFDDYAADGVRNDTDADSRGAKIIITPGPYYGFTGQDGNFRAYLPEGQYQVCLADSDNWFTSWTRSGGDCYDIDIQSVNDEVLDLDFGRAPSRIVQELDLCIVGERPRPGFVVKYYLTYINTGTIPYTGNLTFDYNAILEYVSSSVEPDVNFSGRLSWMLQDVPVGASYEIVVEFTVPADVSLLGTELCSQMYYDRKNRADEILRNGADEFCHIIRGAYDPNEIIVTPRGEGPEGRIALDKTTLSYTIYFQNVGTDTAFNVRILNPIEADLDIASFEMGHASHPVDVTIAPDRTVTFAFANARLPHKAVDEPGSQGFVRYYMNPIIGEAKEVKVNNDAGIYFDFNPPIMTNTAVNTLVSSATSVEEDLNESSGWLNSLQIAPNPADASFVVSGLNKNANQLRLLDALGREHAVRWTAGAGQISVNSSELAPGTYWLNLSFAGGGTVTLPLVVQR